jgi:hypothetical protein
MITTTLIQRDVLVENPLLEISLRTELRRESDDSPFTIQQTVRATLASQFWSDFLRSSIICLDTGQVAAYDTEDQGRPVALAIHQKVVEMLTDSTQEQRLTALALVALEMPMGSGGGLHGLN